MLALYKPWRSGKELRDEQQSWDDAFFKHKFSLRQSEIMKYFNVRYECLDARDDFAAQMKKGEYAGIFSNWDVNEHFQVDLDQSLGNGDDFECKKNSLYDTNQTGPLTDKQNKEMAKVEEIMCTVGWFNPSPYGPADVGDLTPVVPTQVLSGSGWKAAVQNKRQ